MSGAIPRLRMFAGPNGSGKTTIKNNLGRPPDWFGIYINPDDLEASIRNSGRLSLASFGLDTTTEEIQQHFASSVLLQRHSLSNDAATIQCRGAELYFGEIRFNSYHASVLSDFLRRKALQLSKSFSFETVMSSPDKIALLREAQSQGFRTYLYYVATEDPAINIERVKLRTAQGGHDVPEDKIVSRYHRSLQLLIDAVRFTNRAFFFDTSASTGWYFAKVTDGKQLQLESNEMPNWFQTIWKQL
jgi:predicted ABC-type ATPase